MSYAFKLDSYISAEDYLATERAAEYRSEWCNGIVIRMAGASQEHIDIVDNLTFGIRSGLSDRTCRTAVHDLRVKTSTSYVYPDIVVTCGNRVYSDMDCLTNPQVIIEVLSPSTEKADRGWKLREYRAIHTIQEIVFVHQDQPIVERYSRLDDTRWLHDIYLGLTQTLTLESLGVAVSLAAIYENVAVELAIPPQE